MFSKFDDYLQLDFLIDYWYDEAQEIASSMLARFEESDWAALSEACEKRSADWRIRCAEMMSATEHREASHTLLRFLSAPEDDVVITAADHLRSKKDIAGFVTSRDVDRLRELALRGSPPVRGVLEKFLEGLRSR